jgi:predicted S18 family serine protease
MGFFDMFKKNKKDETIKVTERKQHTLQDVAAAVAFAEAGEHETVQRMMDTSIDCKKMLVIGREDSFSRLLTEYALNMAKRMEFEIIALSCTEEPLTLAAAELAEATELFKSNSTANTALFLQQATEKGIQFGHIAEVGNQDAIVEKLHAEHPGMRYVLTEPDLEVVQTMKGRVTIPVFDLNSFHGTAA